MNDTIQHLSQNPDAWMYIAQAAKYLSIGLISLVMIAVAKGVSTVPQSNVFHRYDDGEPFFRTGRSWENRIQDPTGNRGEKPFDRGQSVGNQLPAPM